MKNGNTLTWSKVGAVALLAGSVVSCDPLQPLTNINETPVPANIRLSNANLNFAALSDTQTVNVRVVTANGDTIPDAAINLSLDGSSVQVTTIRNSSGASLRIIAVENGSATIHVNAGAVSAALTAAVDQAVTALALSDTALGFSTVGQTAQIDARPLDGRGNVVANAQIHWTSEDAEIVSVDSSGVVTSVRSGSTTVVATAEGTSAHVSVTVQQTVDRLVVTDGDGQVAPVATAVPTPPSVTLLDSEGNPIPDMLVSFTASSGGGVVAPSSAVRTDAGGIARLESWTLGPTMGINRLIATAVAHPNATVTISATGTAGEATTIRALAGNNQSAIAGTAVSVSPTVLVTDAYGNAVSGQSVMFSPAPGSGVSIPAEPIITGANGIAAINSWTLGTSTGPQVLIATAENENITGNPVTFVATATTGAAATIAIQSGDGQSAVAGQPVALAPSVLVTDALGNPVPNVHVNFSVTLGGGSIQPTTSVATNGSGIAALQSWTLGPDLGANTLSATVVGLADGEVVFTAQGVAGSPSILQANGPTQQTTNAGSTVPIAPSVRVTDAAGHPVRNVAVNFTLVRGGGTIQPSAPVLTDANGIASLASWTLGTVAGVNEVRATNSEIQSEVLFTATATAGPPATIAINGGNNQSALVGTNVAVAPSTKVTDQFGNVVANAPVSFRITGGGGSIAPTQSVATGPNGVAQLTSWTLGNQVGSNTLVATAVGVATGVTFTATGTSGAAAAIQLVTGNNQTAVVGSAVPVAPSVRVTDAYGNAVANTPVVFAVTTGGGTVQPTTPVATDGAGIAQALSWTLGLTAGTNTLTASATGVPGMVTFTATGTPGAPGRISIVTQPSNTAASGVPLTTQPVVEIQDNAGNTIAQPGVPITAVIASGGGTLTGTTTINTNAQGSAAFTDLTISGTVGARTISFVSAGYVTPQSSTIQVSAGPADRVVIASGNNQTAQAGTAVASSPAALVTDASGNPVANVSVTFSVGAGSGSINPTTPITTNSDGLAALASWTLGTSVGAQSLTATAAGIPGTLTFNATSTSGPAAVVLINAGNNQTAQAATSVAIAPSVRVTDTYGNPVGGTLVNFAVTGGGGTAQPTTAVATNGAGIAGLSSWTMGTTAGTNTLRATAVGVAQGVTFQATAVVGVPSAIAVNAGNGQTAVAGAAVPVPPSAKVTDQFGNPVPGVPVTFNVTGGGGTVNPTNSISTNANGVAALTTWTLGVAAGLNTITANASGVPGSASFTATGTAGPAAAMTIISGNGQTATVGTAVAVAPSVRVADANNNAVAGISVTFAVSTGNGIVDPTSAVVTNGAGTATVNSWVLGSTPGANSLTVNAGGVPGSVTFNATATTGAPTTLVLNGGQNQTAIAGTKVPVVPSVRVNDALGNPVANVAVTFSVTGGGGSVVPTGSVSTGADGIAAVTSWTLGPSVGTNTMRATATAIAGASIDFTATGTVGPPALLEITAGNNQTATVGTAVAVAPSVRVTDVNHNPVAGASVTFAVATGNGAVNPTNAIATNASGVASLTSWVLGSTPGSNSLTVSAVGVAGSATFNATATTGPPTTLTINSGQNQTAPAGTAVPIAPSVLVKDALGNPVANVPVAFSVTAGGGVVVPTTNVSTGANGVAAVTSWTMGQNTGANALTATSSAIAGASVVFNATATVRPPITLEQTVSASRDKSPYTLPTINGGTNQTYVLFVTTEDNKDVTGVSGGGLTWVERKEQCASEEKTGIRVWTAQGSPSSFITTVTISSGKDAVMMLSRYSGVTSVEGAAGNNEGGGGCGNNGETTDVALTLTSTAGGSVHVIGLALEHEDVASFASGYTEVGSISDGNALMWAYSRGFTPGATDTFTATLDKKDQWAAVGIVLRQ